MAAIDTIRENVHIYTPVSLLLCNGKNDNEIASCSSLKKYALSKHTIQYSNKLINPTRRHLLLSFINRIKFIAIRSQG